MNESEEEYVSFGSAPLALGRVSFGRGEFGFEYGLMNLSIAYLHVTIDSLIYFLII